MDHITWSWWHRLSLSSSFVLHLFLALFNLSFHSQALPSLPFPLRCSLCCMWFVNCCRMPRFFLRVFVVSPNPADLCLYLLMANTDPAPDNLLEGNGVNSPLQEASLEGLSNLLPGCPEACRRALGSQCHCLAMNHC